MNLFNAARQTSEQRVENAQSSVYFLNMPTAGISVNEQNALTYSAVYDAVRLISEDIACLPWHVYEKTGKNREIKSDHGVDYLLHVQPNPEMSAHTFKETLQAHALTWGNGYAEIERNMMGDPVALWPITPDRVATGRNALSELGYTITQSSGSQVWNKSSYMLNINGLGFDGLVGYGVISLASQAISLGLASEAFGASFFGNGAVLSGIITAPEVQSSKNKMTELGVKNLLKSFFKKYGGSRRANQVGYLDNGMTYKTIGIPPEQAQFLETRKFQISEIARWFRVPPHKIGDLENAAFKNIEQENISYVQDSLTSWVVRWESEAKIKLFKRPSENNLFTSMNLNSRMRGDTKTRGEFYKTMFNVGAFSVNKILELEDENGIGPAGDAHFVPMNMMTLEEAVNNGNSGETRTRSSDVSEAHAGIFVDVCSRLITKEIKAVARASDKRKGVELVKWTHDFYSKHKSQFIEALTPVSSALSKLIVGSDSFVAEMLETKVSTHCAGAVETISGDVKLFLGSHHENAETLASTIIESITIRAIKNKE